MNVSPSIEIQFAETLLAADGTPPFEPRTLEEAAAAVLQYVAPTSDTSFELTIVVSDDAQLQALNRQFLDIDAPTDVLSFPADEPNPDSDGRYLGDVVISLARASAQAEAAGHAAIDELRLLVVHGVLHLLGHDHAEADEKAVMWALQSAILAQLGCAGIAPQA
jgi:probable rRNA maturation factor